MLWVLRKAAVEHTAVTGDEIAEILHADHALEQRLRKVADLSHGRGEKRRAHAQPYGQRVLIFENEIYYKADEQR